MVPREKRLYNVRKVYECRLLILLSRSGPTVTLLGVAAPAPDRLEPSASAPLIVGRYAIFDAIAAGGMATVHLGRLLGPSGFSRTVAIKRLHPQFANDPDFTEMFLDEARMAARVQHPNVIPTIDVLRSQSELLLVMEYVRGDSLARLIKASSIDKSKIPPRIVVAILSGALQGLHAAHEATNEKGRPLGLVHRDMSPQNIIVGVDGTARVLDFGVAKAEGRLQTTQEGQVKGKLMYMPPEQLSAENVTRTADIYSMGVVLFEALTGVRMFAGQNEGAALSRILRNELRMPSEIVPELAMFDAVVRRASAADPLHRYATAREMSHALEGCVTPASASEVGAWVERLARTALDDRARRVSDIESTTSTRLPANSLPPPPSAETGSGVQLTPSPSRLGPKGSSASSKRLMVGMGVGLLFGTLVFAYLLESRKGNTSKPEGSPATVPARSEATVPKAEEVVSVTTPAPPVHAPTVSATTTVMRPFRPVPIVTATAKPKPTVNCNPPYTVDQNGHRHFIPECN
jgi:eukaryotic-like serine/threonine-protein kinase